MTDKVTILNQIQVTCRRDDLCCLNRGSGLTYREIWKRHTSRAESVPFVFWTDAALSWTDNIADSTFCSSTFILDMTNLRADWFLQTSTSYTQANSIYSYISRHSPWHGKSRGSKEIFNRIKVRMQTFLSVLSISPTMVDVFSWYSWTIARDETD